MHAGFPVQGSLGLRGLVLEVVGSGDPAMVPVPAGLRGARWLPNALQLPHDPLWSSSHAGSRVSHAGSRAASRFIAHAGFPGPGARVWGEAMPKMTSGGKPKESELPATLRRSPAKAKRTFAEVHDRAAEEYGEGRRAHQTAYAALKRSFEKVGDHWEPKRTRGPSDEQAAWGGARSRRRYRTHEGVDAYASKTHLYDIARRLDIPGRSRMTKDELVEAIERANRRASARAS